MNCLLVRVHTKYLLSSGLPTCAHKYHNNTKYTTYITIVHAVHFEIGLIFAYK